MKRPCYKKKCEKCGKFKFIRPAWKFCLDCWEATNGKYEGKDRELWVNQ